MSYQSCINHFAGEILAGISILHEWTLFVESRAAYHALSRMVTCQVSHIDRYTQVCVANFCHSFKRIGKQLCTLEPECYNYLPATF